ncbi:hypothetical protein L0P88_13685 [Muricauda sp. SCSIO 64092]|uniref:hypothetical protein n=1 Tax=Allomuricauda sp. SCSIO 64092 TaxID=2908842 RepID=UPI001FF3E587|nr:hypothetical protein [Muricauda sp. SCSIO 64092]UOY05003.1 hypothetical protein L0P88_13685 [Muricauda sp. SCSIO 64092]
MYHPKDLKQLNLNAMHTDELEEMVGNDANILSYFIDCWDTETAYRESLNPEQVWITLEKIGMETHYLRSKPITKWDTYDYANYRSLRLRSGEIQEVYGIYDRMVSQDDVDRVDSPPRRFYGTRELAESAMRHMIEEEGFEEGEMHLLYTYKAT